MNAATLVARFGLAALVFFLAIPTTALAQEAAAPSPGQQVVLVTGATSGLGRELAMRLGARGDHVIVHGRSEERGAQVVDAINGTGPGSARFYRADFASFSEVRRFAETLLDDYDRLDVLINNAGYGSAPNERMVTEDGHEYRFQVNYLSTFLLTHMLMPRLQASVPARIVNVSSGAQTPIDFDDPMIENDFSGRRAYAQSKLAQIMFTHDLAEDLAGTGIVVGSLHPATYMPTAMVERAGATPRSTIAEGADAVMQVVDSDDFESGQYFNGLRPARANAQAYDQEARARLKRLSEELTGITAAPDPVQVVVETDLGAFEMEVDVDRAPATATNFLRYVDGGHYDGGAFFRTVHEDNQLNDSIRIAVIQGSRNPDALTDAFAPIALERTIETGIGHIDGAVSMARGAPDTATHSFFICIGDQPSLDFGGMRNPDGQGFAAFGRVVGGMDVVRAIHAAPYEAQMLTPPVRILRAYRTADPPALSRGPQPMYHGGLNNIHRER